MQGNQHEQGYRILIPVWGVQTIKPQDSESGLHFHIHWKVSPQSYMFRELHYHLSQPKSPDKNTVLLPFFRSSDTIYQDTFRFLY